MSGSALTASPRTTSPYRVVAVVGPTASGKSALADELSLRLGGEVVSADAMQVYRGMDIGTAKTPVSERRVPLHCVDLVPVDSAFSVALYAEHAHAAIDGLLKRDMVPVVCGGTGLYVRAALEEMDFPPGDQTENPVRAAYARLAEEIGPDALYARLVERDPESAALIHPNNVRRVIRAFELLEQGTTYACEHSTLHVRRDRHPTLYLGLNLNREVLYERINARVDRMVGEGLLAEVESLVAQGLGDALTSRQAIGYKEMLEVVRGEATLDDAVERIKTATRRYAKRQLTWFRSDERIHWLDATRADVSSLADEAMGLLERPESESADQRASRMTSLA